LLLEPQSSSDWRPVYRLLTALVLPRPIAWVSTRSAAGARNLAPFSFFNVVCANPPVVVFCPMLSGRTGKTKDTLSNLREVPEFVIQVVSHDLVERMNMCSGEFAPEVDEFEVAGLTPVPARSVSVDRVAEAHAFLECRLREIVMVGEGPGSGSMVLGEVVLIEVEEAVLGEGEVLVDRLAPIGRLAGADYCTVENRFSLQRPEPESLGRPGRS
jgi:flavin reductase (DIM6/NTAB) family NADH-FMN oxidoreductase RutF